MIKKNGLKNKPIKKSNGEDIRQHETKKNI